MRILNDNNHHKRLTGACATMVRQRAFITSDAKVDSQANGVKKRAASK